MGKTQVYRVLGGAEEEVEVGGRVLKTLLSLPDKAVPFEVTAEELQALHDRDVVQDGERDVTLGTGKVVKRPGYKTVDKGLSKRFSLTPPGGFTVSPSSVSPGAAAPGPPRKKPGGD